MTRDARSEAHPRVGSWFHRGSAIAGFFAFLLFGCSSVEIPPEVNDACRDVLVRSCDSAAIPADVVSACHDLFLRRVAFAARCTGPGASPASAEEQAYVDTCAGIATAPGVTLTPQDIKACGEQMDASPCLGGGVFPSCAGYGGDLLYPEHDKKGTLAPGAACFAHVQCDSGYCDHGPGEKCGVCKRARAEGESCGDAMDVCAVGSCSEGKCQTDGKKLGEECTTHGRECQPALYCELPDPMQLYGKCVARAEAGAPCEASDTCAEGLVCQAGVCAALAADGAACADDAACSSYWCNGGTCAARPTGLTEGADCSVGYCRADLLCDESRVCAAPTYLPKGAACTSSDAPQIVCERGLYCRPDCAVYFGCLGSTCEPLPQPGEYCTPFGACASGAVCEGFDATDASKGRCVKLGMGRAGEACPCADALACVAGACVAYGACQ